MRTISSHVAGAIRITSFAGPLEVWFHHHHLAAGSPSRGATALTVCHAPPSGLASQDHCIGSSDYLFLSTNLNLSEQYHGVLVDHGSALTRCGQPRTHSTLGRPHPPPMGARPQTPSEESAPSNAAVLSRAPGQNNDPALLRHPPT